MKLKHVFFVIGVQCLRLKSNILQEGMGLLGAVKVPLYLRDQSIIYYRIIYFFMNSGNLNCLELNGHIKG